MTSLFGRQNAKPRTRTFTGCYTCRARKVKCDEARPCCASCTRLRLKCRGYGIRLVWLPIWKPDVDGNKDVGQRFPDSLEPASRIVLFESKVLLKLANRLRAQLRNLSPMDVLDALHSFDVQVERFFGGQHSSDPAQFVKGPFSAFTVAMPPTQTETISEPVLLSDGDGDEVLVDENDEFELLQERLRDSASHTKMRQSSNVEVCSNNNLHDPLCTLQSITSAYHLPHDTSSEDSEEAISYIGTEYLESERLSPRLMVDQTACGDMGNPLSNLNFQASPYLPSGVRFLMRHYVKHTIHSLASMPIDHAPWKSIHVPIALRAYAELDMFGQSSLARVSLLYSLLAISCYHLKTLYARGSNNTMSNSQQTTLPSHKVACEQLDSQAHKFRAISRIAFRKHMIGLTQQPNQKIKYKECLLAAMSLICVGIISGDTWDSRYYILQSESIVCKYGSNKQRFSEKALALHRIFSFIRIMEQTTFCQSQDSYITEVKDRELLEEDIKNIHQEGCHAMTWSAVPVHERLMMSDLHLHDSNEESTFFRLYGIPRSLFQLLARTNAVVDEMDDFILGNDMGLKISSSLLHEMTLLEEAICAWKSPLPGKIQSSDLSTTLFDNHFDTTNHYYDESIVFPQPNSFAIDPNLDCSDEIGLHMEKAMHNAILVYFFRSARFTNPLILQHYVESIVQSLEYVRQIKTRHFRDVGIGTIVWPAFIAACEALSSDLQERALACMKDAELAGFQNGKSAIDVAQEVWRRRNDGDRDITWRMVVRTLRSPLLLT